MESYASGEQVRNVQMPSVAPKEGSDEEKLLKAGDLNQIQNAYPVPHLDKQLPKLITLSLLPRSQWQNLTNLDIIKVSLFLLKLMNLAVEHADPFKLSRLVFPFKGNYLPYLFLMLLTCGLLRVASDFASDFWLMPQMSYLFSPELQARNKPVEPPKKPEKAPFFLPSIPSLSGEILFKPNGEATEEKDMEKKMIGKKKLDLSSQFILLLHSCMETKNCKFPTI